MWSLNVYCRSITTGIWHDSALSEILWTRHMWRILLRYSAESLSLSNRALCYGLRWLMTHLNLLILYHLFLYHLLGHVTFVSHYLDDDITARHVVTCRTMLNVCKKLWMFGHMTCTLFSNVAFISNRIDDVIAKHAMTYCDLSRHVLEKSLITLSNKIVDACVIANAFLY